MGVSAKKSSGRRAGQEVMLAFVIKANQTTAKAMTRLVDSQVWTGVQANQHFKSKLPSGAEITTVTPAGATDSSSCQDNSYVVDTGIASSECACNAGYTGTTSCSACDAGKYKIATGSASC